MSSKSDKSKTMKVKRKVKIKTSKVLKRVASKSKRVGRSSTSASASKGDLKSDETVAPKSERVDSSVSVDAEAEERSASSSKSANKSKRITKEYSKSSRFKVKKIKIKVKRASSKMKIKVKRGVPSGTSLVEKSDVASAASTEVDAEESSVKAAPTEAQVVEAEEKTRSSKLSTGKKIKSTLKSPAAESEVAKTESSSSKAKVKSKSHWDGAVSNSAVVVASSGIKCDSSVNTSASAELATRSAMLPSASSSRQLSRSRKNRPRSLTSLLYPPLELYEYPEGIEKVPFEPLGDGPPIFISRRPEDLDKVVIIDAYGELEVLPSASVPKKKQSPRSQSVTSLPPNVVLSTGARVAFGSEINKPLERDGSDSDKAKQSQAAATTGPTSEDAKSAPSTPTAEGSESSAK